MNVSPQQKFELDPALNDAIKRLTQAGEKAMEDLELVSNAVTPVKSFLQINSSVTNLFAGLDWNAFYANMLQPSIYAKPIETLTEIQEAALKKFTEGQQHLLTTISTESKELFQPSADIDKPQQAIASYIDKSLHAYSDIKNEMLGQSQTVSIVNSAYMAWLQQTLELFGHPKDEKEKQAKGLKEE